jgi:hypothetical protein
MLEASGLPLDLRDDGLPEAAAAVGGAGEKRLTVGEKDFVLSLLWDIATVTPMA